MTTPWKYMFRVHINFATRGGTCNNPMIEKVHIDHAIQGNLAKAVLMSSNLYRRALCLLFLVYLMWRQSNRSSNCWTYVEVWDLVESLTGAHVWYELWFHKYYICILNKYIYIFFLHISNSLRPTRYRASFESRKHTCDVDMRRAYAIGVLDTIEDTLKVHMYWLNVQGLRVKAFVVYCLLFAVRGLLFNVCCLGHSCWSTVDKQNENCT